MDQPPFPGGIWFGDFEFGPAGGVEGNPPAPVCLVARNLCTNQTVRLWREELLKRSSAPFPIDKSSLFVAYYASAEMGCFLSLGWPMPEYVLDLYVEFRNLTNGLVLKAGTGLLGALIHFGLEGMSAAEKTDMRDLVLGGGPWSDAERQEILEYCESDVDALARLFPCLLPHIDWPRALLRGRYTRAVAHMEFNGTPIDVDTLKALQANWQAIRHDLIRAVDADYGVFDETTFKQDRFARYLNMHRISWPTLPSGALDLSDDTFRALASSHPQLTSLRELRAALSQLRLTDLAVGDDGRNRTMLSMFRAKTGRNQPSNARFIFGPSVWIRCLIMPEPGMAIAYIDWEQQEFGIAAALSGDANMMKAYRSGDPYLAFAIQAGAAPPNATKQSHKTIRDQFKACILAVQYGMQAESLAIRINQSVAHARQLLRLHCQTFPAFWRWSENVCNHAMFGHPLQTRFGWTLHAGDTPNERSLRNFPVQANGAEMLRLACTRLTDDGIRICAPIHDAILIETPLANLNDVVGHVQSVMRSVSAVVLDGFALESDAKIVRSGERYVDERGVHMWNTVMQLLNLPNRKVSA